VGEWCRRSARWLVAAGAALAPTLAGGIAHAQQTTFYLDRIQISGAPDDGLVAWRPYIFEKTRFYGAATLGYTHNPLRSATLTDNPNVQQRMQTPLSNQLVAHLAGGAEFSGRFGLSFSLPVTVFQGGGEDPAKVGVGNGLQRSPVAVHDLRLIAKVRTYQSDNRRLQLGGGVAIWFPTGNANSFAGDDLTTAHIYASGEYDFGPFQLAGNLGPHFRPDRGIQPGALDVGSELRWAGTVFFPLRQGNMRLGGSLWGTTGVVDGGATGKSTLFNGRNTDLEWLGELRVLLDKASNVYFTGGGGTRLTTGYGAPDIRILATIGSWTQLTDVGPGQVATRRKHAPDMEMHDKDTDGDGYPDDVDLCPTEKEDGKPPEKSDGCPAPKDRDGDGIPDDADKCPDDPEDKDGIMDADGCPETDADKDGILDTEDACPLVPGVANKDPKKNGCKEDHKKIVETSGSIQLLEPIQFDTARSTIKAASFPVLDEVVDVLRSRPEIRMAVYGHTDSHGSAVMNTQLSKDRAKAVLTYLTKKGIAPKRLESDGFGPDKPISTNDTEDGRAKNRRVEFKVLE
jgi:outer membrane protein OmpA-like peptidoglycan-associated protein